VSGGLLYFLGGFMVEKDIAQEIAYYNAMPCKFEGFMDVPNLSDGAISLGGVKKSPAIPEKKWVPAYSFDIIKYNGEKVGEVNLRIGYTDGLYYGGQIGYGIDEAHRGNGYAARACRLLVPMAKFHGMTKLLVTNEESNTASQRVCEKLGARFVRKAELPAWHDLYESGWRFVNIYEWSIMPSSEVAIEIAHYNALPFEFEGFMDAPNLSDGVIRLELATKHPADPEKGWVPMYEFDIIAFADGGRVGDCRLRIGYSEGMYYSGQIGYAVDEVHRGKGYALRACRLLAQAAKYHKMVKLLITNDDGNIASYRVCEKLGAKLVRKAELPIWHDMYEEGHRHMNIFEWDLEQL